MSNHARASKHQGDENEDRAQARNVQLESTTVTVVPVSDLKHDPLTLRVQVSSCRAWRLGLGRILVETS
jgi:hypothetical protein